MKAPEMSVVGNMDRSLSSDETRLAAKMAADFMRRMGGHPRELTVYTLSAIIRFMANGSIDSELVLVEELRALSASSLRPDARHNPKEPPG